LWNIASDLGAQSRFQWYLANSSPCTRKIRMFSVS
jgi:hypothetical protein